MWNIQIQTKQKTKPAKQTIRQVTKSPASKDKIKTRVTCIIASVFYSLVMLFSSNNYCPAQQNSFYEKSKLADALANQNKYVEAENLLLHTVWQTKKNTTNKLDLAFYLVVFGRVLYAQNKYQPALEKLQEAENLLSKEENNQRCRIILIRCLATKSAILLGLKKYAEAESLARKAITYTIAFPNETSNKGVKKCYILLQMSLQAQNKIDEANQITEILSSHPSSE